MAITSRQRASVNRAIAQSRARGGISASQAASASRAVSQSAARSGLPSAPTRSVPSGGGGGGTSSSVSAPTRSASASTSSAPKQMYNLKRPNGSTSTYYITPAKLQEYLGQGYSMAGGQPPPPPPPPDTPPPPTTPTVNERENARKEAEEYYGYTLPTNGASWKYPEMEAEIRDAANIARRIAGEDLTYLTDQITTQKQELLRNYQDYLEDIETGKLRTGESNQVEQERGLELKKEYLNRWGLDVEQIGRARTEFAEDYERLLEDFTIARARLGEDYGIEQARGLELKQEYLQGWGISSGEISAARANLSSDYSALLEDLGMSKAEAGERKQLTTGAAMADRGLYLKQWEINTEEGIDSLQKGWIQKGGLFSGVRVEAANKYMEKTNLSKERYLTASQATVDSANLSYTQAIRRYESQEKNAGRKHQQGITALGFQQSRLGLAKQKYLSGWEYGKEQADLSHERTLEDYELGEERAELAYERGLSKFGEQEAAAGMAKQQYLSGVDYGRSKSDIAYRRAMEDYTTQQGRTTETYDSQLAALQKDKARYEQLQGRITESIGLQEIQDIRSLQELYQQAIGSRMAGTLEEKY